MIIFLSLLFSWVGIEALPEEAIKPVRYLVKVDLLNREDIYRLDSLGISILEDRDKYVLAEASYNSIEFLKRNKFIAQVLDTTPQEKEYYLVFLVAGKNTEPLKAFGKILFALPNVVLLRTFKDKEGLFSGRWELKRLRKLPIKIKRYTKKRLGLLKDPIIEEIVDAVELDSIKAYIQKLQDFVTRYSFTTNCVQASQWIYNKFTFFGIDSVYYHWFGGGYAPNVIATIVGSKTPQRVYIICGHFDCTSQTPSTLAPGADDNASGTAAAIEAARVLSIYGFESTIRFIAFCGEEQGLVGSGHYAAECSSNGDSILGVFNCDMIGYNAGSNTMVVGKNAPSEWIADFFIACVDSYVTGLATYKFSAGGYSDHASFWDEGYDALYLAEYDFSPAYHTTGDTLGILDPVFFTKVVEANVAALASFAGPKPRGWVRYLAHEIDDTVGGDGDGIIDLGETIEMPVWVKNAGTEVVYGVTGRLTTQDSFIVILDSLKSFGNIAGGDSSFTGSDGYGFIVLNNCLPYGHIINFNLTCKDNSDSTWVSSFSDITGGPGVMYADHNIGNVKFTVTCQGICGFESQNGAGSGFCYPKNGANWLCIGSLWVGNSKGLVVNRDYSDEGDVGWKVTEVPDGKLRMGDKVYSDQDGWAMYNDAGHPAKRGITITQRSWAWQNAPYDDFVIIQYIIKNKGVSQVYKLYVGQFMDFDMDTNSYDDNNVGTDSTRRFTYMWSNSHPQYVGVKLLDPKIATNLSALKNKAYLSPSPNHYIPDSTKFKFLKGILHFPSSDSSENWSVIVSAGPFDLDVEDDTTVAFAIIGGNNISDAQYNADRAQEMYDSITAVELPEVTVREFFEVYPNPFTNYTIIRFQIPDSRLKDSKIQIYDIAGRVVRTFNHLTSYPFNQIVWDGKNTHNRNILSGIYFCQVKTGKICRTQKIILIK